MSKIKDNLAGNDFIRRTILSILEVRGLIKLSDKKKKIIYNILDGKSTIQIGKEMGVSSTLVSYYWKEICTEMYKEVNNFSNRYSHLKKIEKENVHLKSQNRILNNRLGKKVDLENEELTVKLIDYNLSVRTINALYGKNIKTLGDLIGCYKEDILKLPNMGVACIDELDRLLKKHGLKWLKKNK